MQFVLRCVAGLAAACAAEDLLVLVCSVQNPDPKAAQYFAESISKAYAALTDEASRQNYEKYGHPDGPQVRAKLGSSSSRLGSSSRV
jgi:curved DNA-binding protein CbpA